MREEILLTPSAAARLIGKSEQSVKIYAESGKLPCIRTTTGRRLFRQSDCEEFARKQCEKASPEPGAA
jgi:predicted site-specific integrase-resolvase